MLKLNSVIDRALGLIGKNGPIISLYKNPRYNDEPQLFQYTTIIKNTSVASDADGDGENLAGGTAISPQRAVMKALGEGIERYCLANPQKKNFIRVSIRQLEKDYLDPTSLVNFSRDQLKSNKFNLHRSYKDAKFCWIEGYSMTQKKPLLVPAQLIFVPYHAHKEPIIRLPISTGAACGTSLEDAVLRGICEIVERDSFMIFYLNKLTPPRLDLSKASDDIVVKLRESFKRYNLDLYVLDISTDLPLISMMAIIIDNTGIGPAVSVGLKCSLSVKDAIIGAAEEAQQIRSGTRDEMHKQAKPITFDAAMDLKQRGLYWSGLDSIKDLDFFLKSKKIIPVDKFIEGNSSFKNASFSDLIQNFKQRKFEIVFVDTTRPEIEKTGFFVVKVIMPGLQPLYLYEDFKYLGGERLYKTPKILGYKKTPKNESELNSKLHPFL